MRDKSRTFRQPIDPARKDPVAAGPGDPSAGLGPLAKAFGDPSGIAATGPDTLSNSFLGVPVEICIATRSRENTMRALVELGIGPWGLYQFNERMVSDRCSYGEPDPYVIDVAFAQNGPIIWEVMEPVVGAKTLQLALEDCEQALHHVAFDGSDHSMEERRQELIKRGTRPTLSGVWLEEVPFYFFETPGLGSVVLETYVFPKSFVPEPDAWYPGPPPDRDA